MTLQNSDIVAAIITPDGSVEASDGSRQGAGKFDTARCTLWFTFHEEFAQNGNDFWMNVIYFGFRSRSMAGDELGRGRDSFKSDQVALIKNRIEAYYWGNDVKRLPPFSLNMGKFLGVKFSNDWIIVK